MKTFLMMPSFAALCLVATMAHASELTVKITDIRAAQGSLMVSLVNTDAGWKNEAKPVAAKKVPAEKGEMVLKFSDLAPGAYAVLVMHDQNDNGKLDSNFMGIPSEGYGFSNNPNVMRKATFEEAKFEVAADLTITIRLR